MSLTVNNATRMFYRLAQNCW